MISPTILSSLVPITVILLTFPSCGEDPALVEKRRVQEKEIAQLRSDLALMEERLKSLPPDRSDELAAAELEAARLEKNRKKIRL